MTGWLRTHRPSGRQTLAGVLVAAAAAAVGVLTFREVRRRRDTEVPEEGAATEVEQVDKAEGAPEGHTDGA